MDGDAREISVYDCLYCFCLQSYGIEHVCSFVRSIRVYCFLIRKNSRNAKGVLVARTSPCCKPCSLRA